MNFKVKVDKANTKKIVKKQKAVSTLEMYWNRSANARASTWLKLEMMLIKFSSNFIITPWKFPLKLPISVCHCSMSTGIIPQYDQPSYMNPLWWWCWLWKSRYEKSGSYYSRKAPPNEKKKLKLFFKVFFKMFFLFKIMLTISYATTVTLPDLLECHQKMF